MRLESLEPLFKFSIHLSVRKSRENIQTDIWKASLWGNLSTDTPPKFFSKILCLLASVYNFFFFFFTKSRYAEIIRHQILIQTLQFLTRLPTRQDGIKNRDKVYCPSRNSKFTKLSSRRDRSAWPVLKHNQAAKFLKNFQVHFVLFVNISSQTFYTF